MRSNNLEQKLRVLTEKYGLNYDEFISKYTIKNKAIITELKEVALANNGKIHEYYINRHGLTPRHIEVTFWGKYSVALNNMTD